MSSPSTILIVGGTRGIGLEFVRQSAAQNPTATIYATARNPSKATELQALASSSDGRIQIITADATDADSIKLAAEKISASSPVVDRVIYNAGVFSGVGQPIDVGIKGLKENIDTNLYGAYNVAFYFNPLLLKSTFKNKALVFLSSSFGSFGLADELMVAHSTAFGTQGYDPFALYNVSKGALNRLGKELDQVFRQQGLPILLIHPGMVKTDMNANGDMTADESARRMLEVINKTSVESKLFVDYDGKELPW